MKLLDTLDDNDDVQAVHANFDVADDILERVAAS
jgi:transcriptional/translational regulatory protein YebC/TACO1